MPKSNIKTRKNSAAPAKISVAKLQRMLLGAFYHVLSIANTGFLVNKKPQITRLKVLFLRNIFVSGTEVTVWSSAGIVFTKLPGFSFIVKKLGSHVVLSTVVILGHCHSVQCGNSNFCHFLLLVIHYNYSIVGTGFLVNKKPQKSGAFCVVFLQQLYSTSVMDNPNEVHPASAANSTTRSVLYVLVLSNSAADEVSLQMLRVKVS